MYEPFSSMEMRSLWFNLTARQFVIGKWGLFKKGLTGLALLHIIQVLISLSNSLLGSVKILCLFMAHFPIMIILAKLPIPFWWKSILCYFRWMWMPCIFVRLSIFNSWTLLLSHSFVRMFSAKVHSINGTLVFEESEFQWYGYMTVG